RGGELAQFGEVVADPLAVLQPIRELRQDAPGQRDVARLHRDARGGGERLHDGQQRSRGEERRFVGEGVDDLRRIGHGRRDSLTAMGEWRDASGPLSRFPARAAKRGPYRRASRRCGASPDAMPLARLPCRSASLPIPCTYAISSCFHAVPRLPCSPPPCSPAAPISPRVRPRCRTARAPRWRSWKPPTSTPTSSATTTTSRRPIPRWVSSARPR